MRLRATVSVVGILLMVSMASADQKADEKTPPESAIKPLLEKHYGTSSVAPDGTPHFKYTFEYKSIKWGASYEGTYRSDGVPPNTKTMVYPVKVELILTRTRTAAENEKKLERIVGTFGFFKDSFGEWTFRLKEQEREDVKP